MSYKHERSLMASAHMHHRSNMRSRVLTQSSLVKLQEKIVLHPSPLVPHKLHLWHLCAGLLIPNWSIQPSA